MNDNGNSKKDDLKSIPEITKDIRIQEDKESNERIDKHESPDDVINQVTLMEIVIKRHRDNSETMQLICQENLMVNHKRFLIKKLLTAIEIVMAATAKNKNQVVVGNNSMIDKFKNRLKGAFGGKS